MRRSIPHVFGERAPEPAAASVEDGLLVIACNTEVARRTGSHPASVPHPAKEQIAQGRVIARWREIRTVEQFRDPGELRTERGAATAHRLDERARQSFLERGLEGHPLVLGIVTQQVDQGAEPIGLGVVVHAAYVRETLAVLDQQAGFLPPARAA